MPGSRGCALPGGQWGTGRTPAATTHQTGTEDKALAQLLTIGGEPYLGTWGN